MKQTNNTPTKDPIDPIATTETIETTETTETPSQRDIYRQRIAADYPDLDIDNEEEYYTAANQRYDDYNNIKEGLNNLNQMIDKNALFREMMIAASQGDENWNPFKWAIEEKGLDIKALAEDPEYAETFAEAQRKHLKETADGEAMKKEAAENYQKSVADIDQYCTEHGISEDQKNQAWIQIENMLNDANIGKVSTDTFALLLQGAAHDTDVEEAKKQGLQQGLGQNVSDKLRKMPKPERNPGRQQAEPQPQPTPRTQNPFLA